MQPATLIGALLREGLRPAPATIRQGSVAVDGEIDWAPLCAVSHRCGIAPVLYQCLRATSLAVPSGVMDWFRVQYYNAVARNLALLNDLRELLGWLGEADVPAVVLKGPALAHFGLGVARTFHDLDILVRKEHLGHVDGILRRYAYERWPGPAHDYHTTYTRRSAAGRRVLDIHFDIFDGLRSHRPDLAGMWDRSLITTIFDVPARVPDLSDHLLLTIMQLPHHHWAMRLVLDIWQVVLRWGDSIDWRVFLERAGAWHMRVLAKSTLHALWAMYGVPIAPEALSMAHPSGYFERVQWRVAEGAIAEQLQYRFRPRLTWVAPFLLADQAKHVTAIAVRRSLGAGGPPAERAASTAMRRTGATVAALPALGRVFLASIGGATRGR